MRDFPLIPEQASTLASKVDSITLVAVLISIFFSLAIAAAVVFLATRYKRRRADQVGEAKHPSDLLEIAWSVIPLLIMLVLFAWGALVFFEAKRVPAEAETYYVTGKQWMWKFQHPQGNREINTFHVPVGQPIELVITSEDVIHSLYIPAFRIKQDAVPGRYTTIWFEATKTGTYHIFCAEYCGAEHSLMRGSVIVMEPAEYDEWLSGNKPETSVAASGQELFESKSCATCHREDSNARAPYLQKLYGETVFLTGGQSLVADDQYLRESILEPTAKVVNGYQPIMPTFKGQLSEDEVRELIEYIKSMKAEGSEAPAGE